jgi:homoserine kinase type II
MIKLENSIFVEIKETIEKMFSIKVINYVGINKGLLNFKWKVITNKGPFFIKQYNEERFPTSNEKQLKTGLSIQKSLSEKEIRCPHILSFNGDVMLRTKKNIRFVLTELCNGSLIKVGCSKSFYRWI